MLVIPINSVAFGVSVEKLSLNSLEMHKLIWAFLIGTLRRAETLEKFAAILQREAASPKRK